MRVGIIEILILPTQGWARKIYNVSLTKQFASVTPQAISVWCRQLGYETFYAIYYGIGDAYRQLPADLDIVFISCYTQSSPIAYALAKRYRKSGTQTVIGGAHAKSFPADCLRFFDFVVKECDKALIADILAGHFEAGSFISSSKPFDDLPTVEERMPEIRASSFLRGKPFSFSVVPMLASMGCPYQCDFCTDWDTPYRLLSTDRLAADFHYLSKNLPGMMMGFHDPNFGIKLDPILDALETVPPELRSPYLMECSLSILTQSRIQRLKDTKCIASTHGIESWTDYSNKTKAGQKQGLEKVQQIVEHLQFLSQYVPYIQTTFVFGIDSDMGDEPVTLTKHFIEHTPAVWAQFNPPIPFGGTPMYQQQLANHKILPAMPFAFYIAPYLVHILQNYDPVSYFEKFLDLSAFSCSPRMHKQRLKNAPNWKVKLAVRLRNLHNHKEENSGYERILDLLRSNSQFRAFHEGQSEIVPEFYHHEYDRIVGPYAKLLSKSERVPNLAQMEPLVSGNTHN